MKAIVYLRISQDRTGQAAGVSRQREDCERRCVERGWDILSVETDNDMSATSGRRRPGYETMLATIASGGAQVVVAWSLDRLQRNRRDEVRLYETCQKAGAKLSLVNGADLDFTTAAGRFVADSLGSVARLEVEMKSDRQRRAVEQAVSQGRRVGGRRPFGYTDDGMQVRESEAVHVRRAYSDTLAGITLGEIARRWNAAGLTTGQTRWKGEHRGEASPWRRDSVRAVLLNPRNAGLRAHRGEIAGPALWPALVPDETWRATVDVLNNPSRRRAPSAGRALLTGIALCGVCGATVHTGGSTKGGGGGTVTMPDGTVKKDRRTYRCSGSQGHVARAAQPVENYVTDVIIGRLNREDARDLLIDTERPDIDALRVKAVALRERLNAVAVEFADGDLSPAQLRTINERIKGQLAEVDTALADAGRVNVLGTLVGDKDAREAWERMTVSQQRVVVDLLAEVTLFSPGRGTRTFRPDSVRITPKR